MGLVQIIDDGIFSSVHNTGLERGIHLGIRCRYRLAA